MRRLHASGGRSWLLPALLTALLVGLAGCGQATTSHPASPAGSPTPTPEFRALVVTPVNTPGVQSHNAASVYDSRTGLAQPIQANLSSLDAQFAPGDRISFSGPGQIISQEPGGGSVRIEADVSPLLVSAFAWSGSGALAYLAGATPDLGVNSELVIRTPSGATARVELPPVVSIASYVNLPKLQFSPDGKMLLLVDSFLGFKPGAGADQTSVQVRGLDGKLLYGAPAKSSANLPFAATWGTDGRLYFWDGSGVSVADPARGTTSSILPGVAWYNPDTSPDGRYIVFERRDQSLPRLQLLDTRTGKLVSGFERGGATSARFVTSTTIWFHDEVPCSQCMGPTQVLQPLISYDLTQSTESATGQSGFIGDIQPA